MAFEINKVLSIRKSPFDSTGIAQTVLDSAEKLTGKRFLWVDSVNLPSKDPNIRRVRVLRGYTPRDKE